ncbi:MAG: ATP-binding protein, partial [Pseudomonas sp.]
GLLELIGDVLDIARIEAGHMHLVPEATDLEALIAATAGVFDSSARLKGLILRLDLDPLPTLVQVDPLRFRQVLSNLVSNAIKFTERGQVAITLRSQAPASNRRIEISLTVQDTGIGISALDQSRLFQPFAQAEHPTAQQGSGLGLMISRTLCEMMGGQLSLSSELGRGTQV